MGTVNICRGHALIKFIEVEAPSILLPAGWAGVAIVRPKGCEYASTQSYIDTAFLLKGIEKGAEASLIKRLEVGSVKMNMCLSN